MEEINTWWKSIEGERFWLGVTSRDGAAEVLAVPWREGRAPSSLLLHHVRAGDIVFHYDASQSAITSWSIPNQRAHRHRLAWSRLEHAEEPERETPGTESAPSLAVDLDGPVPLERAVGLTEIARTQWDIFPALQALEEQVGDPIYYPFAMGHREETHVVPGHVFKLPSLVVNRFPVMVRAAACMPWYRDAAAVAH